jgi:broad specificity phosphatase PhoE
MSTLTLIRHGQAAAFDADSDRLSPLGEVQSHKLAQYWIARGVAFDEVCSGTLVRQKRTAEIVHAAYAQAGLPWPELRIDASFDEYDGGGIVNILAPALAGKDFEFAKLVKAAEAAARGPERNRHFQRMFEVVVAGWMSGALSSPEVEPWTTFSDRVRTGLREITSSGRSNRRVALFTSGGVVGVIVQTVLRAPGESALQLNWRMRNCSVTEFVFSRDRLSLDLFNATPHLDDPELQSFR